MKYFLLTLLCASLSFIVDAEEAPFYQRISLNHNDGLCDDYVRFISQDAHGFVWVVTNHGLNRFDGNGFKTFTKENSGLTTNELNCVLQDPLDRDKVWIGSRLNGLYCYDHITGDITHLDIPLHTSDITALAVSSDGQIWITHYNFPPEKFNSATQELHRIYPSCPKEFPTRIWCSVEDRWGRYMYLGHESYGMTRINLTTKEYEEFPEFGEGSSGKGRSVYSLHIDDGGCVWAGSDNGVYNFDSASNKFSRPGGLSDAGTPHAAPVKAVTGMDDGTIWAGTPSGISLFSQSGRNKIGEIGRFPGPGASTGFMQLSSAAPSVIFEDSFGNKWVGYNSHGLDVLNSALSPVSTCVLLSDDGNALYETPVWSIMDGSEKEIWLGGEYTVSRISVDGRRIYKLPLKPFESSPVRCMYEDAEGTVWAGTFNSGAFRLPKGGSSFVPVGNIDSEVRSLVWTPVFGILAGTHNGIYRIGRDGNAVRSELLTGQVPDFYITSLLLTKGGDILAGTFGHGLVALNAKGERLALVDKKDGLPSSTVNDIKQGHDGKIWIATRDGMVMCEDRTYKVGKVIRTEDGLHSSNFKAVQIGGDGKVWVSAEDGIACYDPDADRLAFFYKANKSLLNGFIEGSSAVASDGKLMFGSLNGMHVLNIGSDSAGPDSSRMMVTELLANDSKGNDHDTELCLPVNSGRISIPYNLNTFTIKFSNLDVSKNINSEVRYNLKGVNDVWTTSDSRNEAVYRNLKPGKYEFQVSTRYFGGDWSAPETILTITITPPLYLTWWAQILYVALFIAILAVVFYFYRYKVNLEKNLEIERENSKVNRILNEEKLMFYTNVTHELRTPLSLIIGPIEDLINNPDIRDEHRKKLHTVRSSSIRLLNLINGILEFRKTETGNKELEVVYGKPANLVREVALRFKELNNNRNLSFVIDVSQMEGKEMYYDPEIITSILNNLIGNAAKYTRQGVITVSLETERKDGIEYVVLAVADTGEGIAENELPYIFKRYYQSVRNKSVAGTGIGLALVKSLVEIHEASIDVSSEVGKGSVFTVRFIADNPYPGARHKEYSPGEETEYGNGDADPGIGSAVDLLTVLVVEDDEDVRAYIEDSLSETYRVIAAVDGETGWNAVRKEMPDIVISDVMMPGMNGIELCRKIKGDFSLNHIPVILLTAKDSILDKEDGYNSGADSYITKPFSTKLLLARIKNIIDARHRMSLRYMGFRPEESSIAVYCPEGADGVMKMNAGEEGRSAGSEESRNAGYEATLTAADREFIDRLRKIIEDNIDQQELDIAFLTDKMCMSHSTLYRKVKGITGLTPNEFTRKIQLARAADLLKAGVDQVKVADMTGFNSPSYFRRVFKKEFGMTPGEYIDQTNVIHKNYPT